MAFSEVTRLLDPPLYIVTAAAAGERSGCLVGFATQCSISPPRFLVCISVLNHTYRVACRAAVLGVHLVGADQRGLAAHFGELTGDEEDKLAGIAWHAGEHGAPLLGDAPARFEARVLERLELGDHVGHLLEPLEAETTGDASEHGQLHLHDAAGLQAGHPPGEIRPR